jgi:hypothetical protein
VSALQAQRNSHELVSGPYNSPRFTKSLEVNPLPQGSRCSGRYAGGESGVSLP